MINIYRPIFAAVVALLCGFATSAQYSFIASNVSGKEGAVVDLPISMNNGDKEVISFQFDMVLPDGVTVQLENNAPKAVLSSRASNHIVNASEVNGAYRYLSFSMTNAVYSGSEGVILTTPIVLDAAPGDYTIQITNAFITTNDGSFTEIECDNTESTLTITPAVDPSIFEESGINYKINSEGTAVSVIAGSGASYSGSVTIPESVEHDGKSYCVNAISASAFEGCSSLSALAIPSSVVSIEANAFKDCSGLASLKVGAINPGDIALGEAVFDNAATSTCVLKVPRKTATLYGAADQWKAFSHIEEFFIVGDANMDYGVSVADVTTTINFIIGENTADFDIEAADMNGNNTINVADATLITNLVLSLPSVASAIQARIPALEESTTNTWLSMSDLNLAEDLSATVSVEGAGQFVALQFEVNVPDGLSIESVASDANHTAAFNCIADNRYRVVVYSLDNSRFASNEVAELHFSMKGDVEAGAEIGFSAVLVNENISGKIYEYEIPGRSAYVKDAAGVASIAERENNIRVVNGELIFDSTHECDVTIVSVDGTIITKHLMPGFNSFSLPKGVYIVNGKKVVL